MPNQSPNFTYLYLIGILLLAVSAIGSGCQVLGRVISTPVPSTNYPHLGWVWATQGEAPIALWRNMAVGPERVFYVTDYDGTLHAIVAPGHELWQYRGDYEFAYPPLLSPDGELIYFVADDQNLYAVDTDGEMRWIFEADQDIRSMPIVSPGGTIYLQTSTNAYQVFPDGSSKQFPWPEWAYIGDVAIDEQEQLYIPLLFGDLQIHDADGELLRSCDVEGSISSRIVVGESGSFYYLSYTPEEKISVIARDIECNLLWRYTTGEYCGEIDCPLVAGRNGVVYLGVQYGRIYALSMGDGSVLWQRNSDTSQGDIVYLTPADDKLFAVSSNFELLSFDLESGEPVWSYQMYDASLPGLPLVTTKGDLGVVQADRLQVFTADTSVVYRQPTPMPAPVNTVQAEEEIISFVVDFIVEYEIGDTADYIQSSGQPWVDAPPQANIIVLSPVEGDFDLDVEYYEPQLDYDRPLRVWWYTDSQLTETKDKLESIEMYKQLYMEEVASNIWAWGYYGFAIVSVAKDRMSAEVYLGASCGPLCGHGYLYTLHRSPSGRWGIVRAEHLWQS